MPHFAASETDRTRELELWNRCTLHVFVFENISFNPRVRKRKRPVTPCVPARLDRRCHYFFSLVGILTQGEVSYVLQIISYTTESLTLIPEIVTTTNHISTSLVSRHSEVVIPRSEYKCIASALTSHSRLNPTSSDS